MQAPKEQIQVASWNSMSMPLTSLAKIVNDALATIPEQYRASAEVTQWGDDGVTRVVYWRPQSDATRQQQWDDLHQWYGVPKQRQA